MYRRGFSFVIPAYNEARRLPDTLNAIAELSASSIGECEIIVVDDGSVDSTAAVASAFSSPRCLLRIFRTPHRGKGYAIRRGALLAQGKIIVLCDADLNDAVKEVFRLEAALLRGADIAIGSRWLNPQKCIRYQPYYRRISSRVFNLLASTVIALPFKDTQCGLKLITRNAANRIFPLLTLDGWGYDIEMIHVALTHGLQVEEVDLPIKHEYRDSHFRPIVDGLTTLRDLFRVRRNHYDGAYRALSFNSSLEETAQSVVAQQHLPITEAEVREDAA